MYEVTIEGDLIQQVVDALSRCPLFLGVQAQDIQKITEQAQLIQYDTGDCLAEQGEPAVDWFLVVSGEVIVQVSVNGSSELVEVARIRPFETVGEIAVMLGDQRTATLTAAPDTAALRFDQALFKHLLLTVPSFSITICKVFASRLKASAKAVSLPEVAPDKVEFNPDIARLLPLEFMQRQRVVPLSVEENNISIGFVDEPTPQLLNMLRNGLPGMTICPAAIQVSTFNDMMQKLAPQEWAEETPAETAPVTEEDARKKLEQLLERMVAEGASDLHLSPQLQPRWRIDGDMVTIEGTAILGEEEVLALAQDITPQRNLDQFAEENDTDYAYEIPDVSRFRVNLFRERSGVGAVFRQIPSRILTAEQLGLPPALSSFSELPTGLVLVTGPTGSGKSTTLAAMLDQVNRRRKAHIITLEDPIEFVHQSQECLVNQREVGPHTGSFHRALRAALREDPDIVLVGEMRDLETVALALETANTGHLVFATLHTNTAMSTISRIIDMFPSDQQAQIRTVLADVLRGVVTQTLCKRIGGGRVAGFEILVSSPAMSNLIREGKTHQLSSMMQTGSKLGNQLMNDNLFQLVQAGLITKTEAIIKSAEKEELAHRLGFE